MKATKFTARALIAFALFAIAATAWAAGSAEPAPSANAKPKIVFATDATWPPMEYVDENKNIVGFGPDLIAAMAEAGDFDYELRNTAWDGIFAGLETGNYDAICSSVTITDERKQTMDFSEPYVNAGQMLVVDKNTQGVSALKDLVGKKVGAQIGTTGAMEIAKVEGVVLATYDEVGLAFEDLANGRILGVVADSPIAADFAMQNPKFKERLKVVGEPFTDEWLGIAVKKGNAAVLKLINDDFAKVKASGKLDALSDTWLR